MDQNQFKVIYTGQLQDGFTSATVIAAFAERFKLPPAKAKKIIEAGREVVVKPSAEHVKAYKMKSLLESIGMVVRLERAALVKPNPSPETQPAEPEASSEPQPTDGSLADSKAPKPAVPEQPPVKPASQVAAGSWELEPMEAEQTEASEAPEDAGQPTYNDMRRPDKVLEPIKPNNPQPAAESETKTSHSSRRKTAKQGADASAWPLIQTIGGWALGVIGVLFILIKKFGLFKLLKIGGLATAAAFAGYDAEEICMGNDRCESAVEDQADACWEQAGLGDIDINAISDEAFAEIKTQYEEQFVACFRYEDTMDRVFISPLDLRWDLIDNCYLSDNSECLSLAESQLKGCYDRHQIAYLVSANTEDFYQEVSDHATNFKAFYGCFLDNQGGRLFYDIVDGWDEYYY